MTMHRVRNLSTTPLSLPYPYRGVVPGGGSVLLPHGEASIIENLGGIDMVRGIWEIEREDRYNDDDRQRAYALLIEDAVIVAPGRNKAAAINAAILEQGARATKYFKPAVRFLAGQYDVEDNIDVVKSNLRLQFDRYTSLVPTFTGAADDQTNAVVRILGELNTAKLNTTLAANVVKGARSIVVASAGSIAAGDYIYIQGSNSAFPNGDAASMSDSAPLREIARVASTYVGGTTLPLEWPLYQNHGNAVPANITVRAVTPVIGTEIEGGIIRGSQGSVCTAVGILVQYALDTVVNNFQVEGCSRAAVNFDGTAGFRSRGFYNLGTNNSWYMGVSGHKFDIREFDGADGVARVHPLGIPRAQIELRYRCTDGFIGNGKLTCGTRGIFHAGGVNLTFDNILIRNQEITQDDYNRWVASGEQLDGGKVGLGLGSGPGPLPIAEFAFGCTYSNITTEDLRAPNAAGWNDVAPRRAVAMYIHDTMRVSATNLVATNWEVNDVVGGVIISDVEGALTNLTVRGHTIGLACQNALADLKINRYRYDATRGATGNASWPIYLDYNAASNRGIKFDGVHVANAFSFLRFGASFAYDPNFEIRDLITDQGSWAYCVLADNETGVGFNTGDVVEIDVANADSELQVRTPDTGSVDYSGRLAAVASGATEDLGTGMMLIAPLPQDRATVRASSAAVDYGDRIGYAATRRAATVDGAAQPIGKALSRKAAGSEGLIIIGTAA